VCSRRLILSFWKRLRKLNFFFFFLIFDQCRIISIHNQLITHSSLYWLNWLSVIRLLSKNNIRFQNWLLRYFIHDLKFLLVIRKDWLSFKSILILSRFDPFEWIFKLGLLQPSYFVWLRSWYHLLRVKGVCSCTSVISFLNRSAVGLRSEVGLRLFLDRFVLIQFCRVKSLKMAIGF